MLNRLAHYIIGFVVGALMRKRPAAAIVIAATFGIYQIVERAAKDDDAYPEVREFGIGLGIGLAAEAADASVLRGCFADRLDARRRAWIGAWNKAVGATKSTANRLRG